jgi:hypothetical protein
LKNRFFYTTLIHSDAGADSDFYHSLILRAMEYAAGYREPVSLGGAPLKKEDGFCFASSSRRVDVDVSGAFTLSVWSPSGEKLYAAAASGRQSFSPAPLAKAGLYFVRLDAEAGSFSRRVMIY